MIYISMKNDFNQPDSVPYPPLAKNQRVRSRPVSSNNKKYSKAVMRSSQKSGWASSSKYLSKNAQRNKGELDDEALILKRAVNTLKAENIHLKNRVLRGERELNEKNREVRSLLNRLNGASKKSKSRKADPLTSLKRQVFDIQSENKALREGIELLRKGLKASTRQELSIEIQEISEECARLRNVLEEVVKRKPYAVSSDASEEIRKQDNAIEKLKAENKNLAEKFRVAKSEAERLKSKMLNSSNDPVIAEQEKEMQKLKRQIEEQKKSSGSNAKLEDLQREKADLIKKEAEYEEMIRDISMQIIEEKRARKNELRPQSESVEDQKRQVLKLVDKDVIHKITTELRLNLIISNTEFKNLKKILFKNYEDDDKVSIHELSKVFQRGPCKLGSDAALKVARYLVEPRKGKETEFDELREEKASVVFGNLALVMGTYTLKHNSKPEVIQESLLGKISERVEDFADTLQNSADDEGFVKLEDLEQVCKAMNFGLSSDELDYLLLTMYKKSKNADKLRCEYLLKHLEDLLNNLMEKQEGLDLDEPIEKSKEDKSLSRHDQLGDDQEEMSEEEILAQIQKCFVSLATAMKSQGLTVNSLFKKDIYKQDVEGEETELLPFSSFLKAPRKLGFPEFTDVEKRNMERVFSLVGPEKGLQVGDLVQILEDFGSPKDNDMEEEMEIEDLDKVSMVLLLALSDYLKSEKASVEKAFEQVIYKQPVQVDNEELEIEIIDSPEFFEVINKIGIETDESQHDNLKAFLCIDPSHADKLSLDKLRAVVEAFTHNEELRDRAKEYYQKLIEEDQLQEEANSGLENGSNEGSGDVGL